MCVLQRGVRVITTLSFISNYIITHKYFLFKKEEEEKEACYHVYYSIVSR